MFFNINEREFERAMHLLRCLNDSIKELTEHMPALENLTAAVAANATSAQALTTATESLTAAVLVAIPEINPVPGGTGATEAQVQAAADAVTANNAVVDAQTAAVNAQTAAIVKATTPPAPAPTP